MSEHRAPSALRVALAWLPACLYAALIWYLSSQSFDFKLIDSVPLKDKGVHFLEYGALGGFVAFAAWVTWPRDRFRGALLAVWITCILGLTDELHQVYVVGRSGDALDLIPDLLGAILATAGHAGLRALLGRGRQAQPA